MLQTMAEPHCQRLRPASFLVTTVGGQLVALPHAFGQHVELSLECPVVIHCIPWPSSPSCYPRPRACVLDGAGRPLLLLPPEPPDGHHDDNGDCHRLVLCTIVTVHPHCYNAASEWQAAYEQLLSARRAGQSVAFHARLSALVGHRGPRPPLDRTDLRAKAVPP